jgi:hypothetical protein
VVLQVVSITIMVFWDDSILCHILQSNLRAGVPQSWNGRLKNRGLINNRIRGFLFSPASRPALGINQSPIQWVLRALSLGIKHSWYYNSIPPYIILKWCLIKHRDNFTFTSTDQYIQVLGNDNNKSPQREKITRDTKSFVT